MLRVRAHVWGLFGHWSAQSEVAHMGWLDSLNAAAKAKKGLKPEECRKIAQDLVVLSSFGAAAVTYAPLPLTDFILVTPVQASMVMSVGRVYGRELNFDEAKHILLELASVCGMALLAQKGFATLSKVLLPGLGGILQGPYAFGVTYAMGHVAMNYFENAAVTREALKRVFEEALAEGKRLFSREKLEEFRKKQGSAVTNFAQDAAGGKVPAAKRKAAAKKAPARQGKEAAAKRKAPARKKSTQS